MLGIAARAIRPSARPENLSVHHGSLRQVQNADDRSQTLADAQEEKQGDRVPEMRL